MWIKPLPHRPRSKGVILILFVTLATGFFSFDGIAFAATPICACFFSGGGCGYAQSTTSQSTCGTACDLLPIPTQTISKIEWDADLGSEDGLAIGESCTQAQDAVAATDGQTEKNICTCFLTPKGCQEVIGNTDAINQSSCDLEICKENSQIKNRYSGESRWNANVETESGKLVRNLCSAGITPSSLPSDTPQPPSSAFVTPAPRPFITPKLNVEIPDLTFSKIVEENGILEVSYLSNYIGAIYKFLLGAAITFAIVMIMIGGFQYVLSSGGFGDVKKGKERIKNAITGLILLMGVSIILSTVNPQLVLFKPLTVSYIKRGEDIEFSNEEASTRAVELPGGFRAPEGKNIKGEKYILAEVPANLAVKVEEAAKKLEESNTNYGLYITSSFRSIKEQEGTITRHCDHPPAPSSKSCDKKLGDNNPCVCKHKFGKSDACMLLDGDPKNCPHTAGAALDVWGQKIENGNWKNCIKSIKEECSGDKIASCRANPCQAAVIAAMKEAGFCVLDSEPWHFEQAPDGKGVSSSCH